MEETEYEGPFWATGGIDAGGVVRNICCSNTFLIEFNINKIVNCQNCNRCYRNVYPDDMNQGLYCAATLTDTGLLVGGYAGMFDMMVFEVSGIEKGRVLDPICDVCLLQWIREERLTYIKDNDTGEPSKYLSNWFAIGCQLAKEWK